jgi:hypothetical protein
MLVTPRCSAKFRRAWRALDKALVTANVDDFSCVQALGIESCNLAYLTLAHPKPASQAMRSSSHPRSNTTPVRLLSPST